MPDRYRYIFLSTKFSVPSVIVGAVRIDAGTQPDCFCGLLRLTTVSSIRYHYVSSARFFFGNHNRILISFNRALRELFAPNSCRTLGSAALVVHYVRPVRPCIYTWSHIRLGLIPRTPQSCRTVASSYRGTRSLSWFFDGSEQDGGRLTPAIHFGFLSCPGQSTGRGSPGAPHPMLQNMTSPPQVQRSSTCGKSLRNVSETRGSVGVGTA